MSASQLLRILQTLPAAADEEISALNTVELGESMNRSSRCTNPFLSNEEDDKLNFWNNPQLETPIFGNNYTSNNEDEMFRKSTAACSVPSHLFEETAGLYIDKNAVECELPELIVCYKESDIHVEDICIDEETVSINKDNHEFLCKSVHVMNGDDVDDNDMIEASFDTEFLKHEWLRTSSVTACCMDVGLKSSAGSSALQIATDNYGPDTDSSSKTCNEKLNSRSNSQDVSTEPLASNSMLSFQKDWSLTALEFPESSTNYADGIDGQPLNKGSKAEKPGTRSQMTRILSEREMEGSASSYFNTRKPLTGSDPCGGMSPESVCGLPLETEIDLNHHQDVAVAKREMRDSEGETSFSMASVVSELISCSRPIAFSGGISTRSDSSAASTRSFAFPTLEMDYNSSPVRMGRAERRRLQKQRGWRQGLLCCKF